MASDDDSLHPDHSPRLWSKRICEASENYGRPVPRATDYKYWLEAVGFAKIRETISKRPTNTWPKDRQLKEIGNLQLLIYTGRFRRLVGGIMQQRIIMAGSGSAGLGGESESRVEGQEYTFVSECASRSFQ